MTGWTTSGLDRFPHRNFLASRKRVPVGTRGFPGQCPGTKRGYGRTGGYGRRGEKGANHGATTGRTPGRHPGDRPWLLVEADLVRGRTITSWPSLKTDIRNAGGAWVDEVIRTENGLVTSRMPDDLPQFCAKVVEEFAEGRHPAGARR
jgi:DJ-1/PfpI family